MPICAPRAEAVPVAAPALPGLELRLVDSVAAFLALEAEWDKLFARCGRPHQLFQSHVFLRHWIRHYLAGDERLAIVTAWRAGRLVMAWPLVRLRRFGFGVLRFMGGPVAQYSDVLADDEPGLVAAGWRAVLASGADLVEIRKLRADAQLGQAAFPSAPVTSAREEALFADLELRVAADGPSAVYSSRDRANWRRRRSRLSEQFAVMFHREEPGPVAARLARQAIAMKRAWLADRGVFAPALADPRFEAFFAGLAADRSGASPLRLAAIMLDGEPAGIEIAFDQMGVCFGHVLAVDPAFARHGVGGVLIHHSLASAKARGNLRLDMLAPADPYKRAHADGGTLVSDLTVPLSPLGRLLCIAGFPHLRPLAKKAAKSAPSLAALRFARGRAQS